MNTVFAIVLQMSTIQHIVSLLPPLFLSLSEDLVDHRVTVKDLLKFLRKFVEYMADAK